MNCPIKKRKIEKKISSCFGEEIKVLLSIFKLSRNFLKMSFLKKMQIIKNNHNSISSFGTL